MNVYSNPNDEQSTKHPIASKDKQNQKNMRELTDQIEQVYQAGLIDDSKMKYLVYLLSLPLARLKEELEFIYLGTKESPEMKYLVYLLSAPLPKIKEELGFIYLDEKENIKNMYLEIIKENLLPIELKHLMIALINYNPTRILIFISMHMMNSFLFGYCIFCCEYYFIECIFCSS
ncbi:MAG: hypothetical protein PUP46_10720 [Endozoicomonas sp. (ex Botrylloides leachii)]|nr:hypothetical protein [Endozoicomonas sp. (ex Botrylloides leachii)]